jgi:hypothetical protein
MAVWNIDIAVDEEGGGYPARSLMCAGDALRDQAAPTISTSTRCGLQTPAGGHLARGSRRVALPASPMRMDNPLKLVGV